MSKPNIASIIAAAKQTERETIIRTLDQYEDLTGVKDGIRVGKAGIIAQIKGEQK